MTEMIIKGNSIAVNPTEHDDPKNVRNNGNHRYCRGVSSQSQSSTTVGGLGCAGGRKRRREGGDELSIDTNTRREQKGHGLCCVFFTDTCCPLFGINKCRTKKYRWDDPYSQDLLKSIAQHFNRLYGFLHLRLLPSFRPLVLELCFRGCQIEADGLSVVSAQIFAATYILKTHLSLLSRSDREKLKDLYLELTWEAEKSFLVDKQFYAVHQRFKKRILPRIWKLEERYSGERRDFIDIHLRENLNVDRPFDDLYIRDEYKLQGVLKPVVYMKNQTNSREEKEVSFTELSYARRFKIIWVLLHSSLQSIIRVGKGLEKNTRALHNENVSNDPTYPIKCRHTLDIMGSLLKMVKQEVSLPSAKDSELVDWVCCVIDDTNNYLTSSEWVADRVTEARSMTQLCYEHLLYFHQMDLPPYSTIVDEIKVLYARYKVGLGVEVPHMSFCGKREVSFQKENQRKQIPKIGSSSGILRKERKTSISSRNLDSGLHENVNTSTIMIKKMKNGNDFICSEYPALLCRIPLYIDDMKLLFKLEEAE